MNRTLNLTLQSITLAVLLTPLLLTSPAIADEKSPGHGHHDMKNEADKHHGKKDKNKGHHFSPHWAKTLTDEQKANVDRMHLELDRELAILKPKAELAQKELNVYTLRDDADMATINSKIDALLAIKKQIFQKRHAHLIEMRKELTAEQRISYDMAVLKRSGAK